MANALTPDGLATWSELTVRFTSGAPVRPQAEIDTLIYIHNQQSVISGHADRRQMFVSDGMNIGGDSGNDTGASGLRFSAIRRRSDNEGVRGMESRGDLASQTCVDILYRSG